MVKKLKPQTRKLNNHLQDKARSFADITYLASPVTGGGVSVNRFDQLFITSIHNGGKTADDWVEYVWQVLKAQNQRLVLDGKTLESEQENREHLQDLARKFSETQLPKLKELHIV